MPDAVGNLYKNSELEGRKYGKAGELLETKKVKLKYDDDGNLGREITARRDTLGVHLGGEWNA